MTSVMFGLSARSWLKVAYIGLSTSHSGPAWIGCRAPHAVYHFSSVTIWYLPRARTAAALYTPLLFAPTLAPAADHERGPGSSGSGGSGGSGGIRAAQRHGAYERRDPVR